MEEHTGFKALPFEIIEVICTLCDDQSVLETLPRTAKAFLEVLSNDNFWRHRSDAKNISYLTFDSSKSIKYNYQKNLPFHPRVSWSEVNCDKVVEDRLKENFIFPIKFPNLFTAHRFRTSRRALLYGPSGVDKSLLAKAVASEAGAVYFSLKCSELHNKPNRENVVQDLFIRAKKHTPAILFIDEIDQIDGRSAADSEREASRRAKIEFLGQCQDQGEGLYVIAATDAPWDICPAVRRRFDQRLWVGLPDLDTRVKLLKQHLGQRPYDLTEEELIDIANNTVNYSSSDIKYLVTEASMKILRMLTDATHFKLVKGKDTNGNDMDQFTPCSPGDEGGTPMNLRDVPSAQLLVPILSKRQFELALVTVKPSVSPSEIYKFEKFREDFG